MSFLIGKDYTGTWPNPESFARDPRMAPGPHARISACLIVKNEEQFLERYLRSLYGTVSEVVVVDTGSTDRTRQIADAMGARRDKFKWCGDFAAARNHALSFASHPWILSIDADEELQGQPGQLAAKLANPKYGENDLLELRLLSPTVEVGLVPGVWSYSQRVFPADPAVR